MTISRQKIRLFTAICGVNVLLSYLYGLSHAQDRLGLWGGVPEAWRLPITCCMFLAAAGFLTYWWIALFQWTEETIGSLRWPWALADGQGTRRLISAYALLLLPSALWMETTIYHMEQPSSWSAVLPITMLTLAALGAILLALLANTARQDNISGAKAMSIGGALVCLQVVINDWIVWTLLFPW